MTPYLIVRPAFARLRLGALHGVHYRPSGNWWVRLGRYWVGRDRPNGFPVLPSESHGLTRVWRAGCYSFAREGR